MESNSNNKNEIEPLSAMVGRETVEVETETSKLNVFFWAMYDLANTIYSMVIVSLIIYRYVLVIGQLEHGMTYGEIAFIYGLVQGLMQVGLAIIVPFIGAFSDTVGKRKPFVISLAGITLLFASLLGFFHNITVVLIFYVLSNIGYQLSLTFYDAMLPFIASKEDIGKVSGFGVAWGYFGTIIALIVLLPLMLLWGDVISDPSQGTVTYGYTNYWITFILPMGLFLVLGIPFVFVREKQKKGKMPPLGKVLKSAFQQLRSTFKDIKRHRSMFIYLLAYFLIANIANVIVLYMMPLITDGLIVGTNGKASDIFGILFIIIATFSAVLFTYFVGKFGEKYGPKNCFYLIGVLWSSSLFIGIVLIFSLPYINIGLNFPFILCLLMGFIAGPALGGTWTANRIMITQLAPKEKFGEFFGFSNLSGKVSSSIGPIIFGVIIYVATGVGVSLKHSYGFALIAVALVMLLGLFILTSVEVTRKMD
ncbi:MAG: MFS transporter [Candidatus Lokiarchaeota archaeon]|nr:MFS transporter [Candidatus Lokiarchaeota archaeon]MBD3339032.1 MFS transporter [Candidatus Lokiarchaeota archaeon]